MDTDLTRPAISVIMPVYNCAAFVGDAVESILNQTFVDFELIIIDDCSSDNTLAIISGYNDKRIKLIRKSANSGYIVSLNIGIMAAAGEFLARMDGDDISHPERLEKQQNFLNANPDLLLCGTWYELLSSGEVVENPVHNDDIKIALLEYCALGHPTVMFRKSCLTANKLVYNQDFYPAEDYELWTRMILLGKIANIPESLLFYRTHQNQVSFKDQSLQINNSNLCRSRMICYPLTDLTPTDIQLSQVVAKNIYPRNHQYLVEIIAWLNKLAYVNESAAFYDKIKFYGYVEKKKRVFARAFYLHNTSYNVTVMRDFYRTANSFKKYFSIKERFKFALKCIIGLKTN